MDPLRSLFRLPDELLFDRKRLLQMLWPVAFNLPYHFRASGRARFTMWVALAAMAFCRLGLAWLFVGLLHRNVLWVWYAMFVDWVLRIVLYIPAFLKQQD